MKDFIFQYQKGEMPWGYRAGKIRNSGARKTMLLAVRSGARRVPRNFVPLVRLRGTRNTCLPYHVPCRVPHMQDNLEQCFR